MLPRTHAPLTAAGAPPPPPACQRPPHPPPPPSHIQHEETKTGLAELSCLALCHAFARALPLVTEPTSPRLECDVHMSQRGRPHRSANRHRERAARQCADPRNPASAASHHLASPSAVNLNERAGRHALKRDPVDLHEERELLLHFARLESLHHILTCARALQLLAVELLSLN